MSSTCWLTDPSLFMDYFDHVIRLWRLPENYTFPLDSWSCIRDSGGDVTDYLSLVGHSFRWRKSDFDALADFIYRYDCFVNCQGLVLPLNFPRDKTNYNQPNLNRPTRFMSLEVLDLSRYGLPPPSVPFRDVQYLQGRESAIVEYNPKEKELVTKLEATKIERDREKAEKQALEIEVRQLKAMISTLKSKNYLFNQKAI
ncbi:hypothetical protein MKX01_036427 [Papaver californicum]|nr:hypothetical protein MKX01_036427 [Papaver californicum]